VLLASGIAVPISQLKPGEKVLATNTRTGKTQTVPVSAVLVHHDTNRYDHRLRRLRGAPPRSGLAWTVDAPGQPAELGSLRKRVMDAAPDAGDPGPFPGAAVAQNAVAAVRYALEACLTGEVQPSVWAARQLYEAADAVVQQGAAVQTYVKDIDREQPVANDARRHCRGTARCQRPRCR
jgi:hypothetical protein